MAEVDASELDRLPRLTAQIASSLRAVGDELSWRAQEALLDAHGPAPASPRLTTSRLTWRLRLVKQGQRVILLFIRRELPQVPVIDADVRLEIGPVPAADRAALAAGQPLGILFEPPPFLVADATDEDVQRHTRDRRATPANTILLRGQRDGEILAVVRPGRGIDVLGADTRLYHTLPGEPPVRLRSPWPLQPFRSVIAVLARWARSESANAPPRPLALADEESDAARVLATLVDAYRAARESARPAGAAWHPAFAPPVYAATRLAAEVALRLDDDGRFVDSFGKDTFQLQMSLSIEDLGERSEARMRVAVPDFLVSGHMLLRLLDALRADDVVARLAREFADTAVGRRLEEQGEPIDADDVRRFLAGAEAGSIVFRTSRKAEGHDQRVDTDIFAIRRPWARPDGPTEVLAIVRARFRIVDAGEGEPQVSVEDADDVRAMHLGALSGEGGTLDREDVRYFVRLANELHQWSRVLA